MLHVYCITRQIDGTRKCWSCSFSWSHGEGTQHNFIFPMPLHFYFNRCPPVPDVDENQSIWVSQYSQELALCEQNRWPVLQVWTYVLLTAWDGSWGRRKVMHWAFISFIRWLAICWKTVRLFLVAMCAAAYTYTGDEIAERHENCCDAADDRRMKVTGRDGLQSSHIILVDYWRTFVSALVMGGQVLLYDKITNWLYTKKWYYTNSNEWYIKIYYGLLTFECVHDKVWIDIHIKK